MKHAVDYSQRVTPKFDAVEDIIEWLGRKKWDEVSPQMALIKNVEAFTFLAGLAGVHDFAVIAWYDLYFGEGAYNKAWDKLEQVS